jgi:sugar transferase EpsL
VSIAGPAAKRAIDIAAAVVGLACAAPVLAAIALLVRWKMGPPAFLGQARAGIEGRPFRLWKVRTMTDARDPAGALLPDAARLTPLGRWLRARSLDELPQLLNVLVGDMSIVGPRPLLIRYLSRYGPRQRLRLRMRPGITGWAQVHGRNALDWDSRLELDAFYVEHWSIWLDLRILALTALKVVQMEDVRPEASEFWGSQGPPAEGPRAFPVDADETMEGPCMEVKRDGRR